MRTNPPLERTAAAVQFTCGRASRVRRRGRSTALRYPADHVSELNTQSWIAAARHFYRLRRRYWVCFGLGVIVGFAALLLSWRGNSGSTMVTTILGVTFVACWLVAAVTWIALLRFQCPRCGSAFILS